MSKYFLLVVLSAFIVSCDISQETPILRTINVTGYGSIEVEPAYITILMSIQTIDPSPRISQANNEQNSQLTFDLLNQMGVEDKWITTLSYNLREYSEYNDFLKKTEFIGYQTVHELQVRIINIESVSDVMSSLLETGVSSINSISYGIDNYLDVQNMALQKAVEAARVKAEIMVEGQGVRLGSLISVNAYTPNQSRVGGIVNQNILEETHSTATTSLATGARFVRATISVQFELLELK